MAFGFLILAMLSLLIGANEFGGLTMDHGKFFLYAFLFISVVCLFFLGKNKQTMTLISLA
jgi:hypothetical protein